jgi:hypothetical protein
MRPWLILVLGPFIVGGLVVLIVEKQDLSWFAGAVAGVSTAMWLWVQESPPQYVEKWHDGAEGERKTEKALKPLVKTRWRVVHDVQGHYGNYDHIAVGPTGAYLLESKNLHGIVELRSGVPYLRRRHDPHAVAAFRRVRPRALRAAARIKADIQERSGHCVWVQAVVVFWSDFPEQLVDDGRCVYIHGARLADWLRERPQRLDQEQVGQIGLTLESLAEEQSSEN